MKRDISKLKRSLQDEIMSHVCHAPCKTCGGSGLNEVKELYLQGMKINGCLACEGCQRTGNGCVQWDHKT